MSDLKTSKGNVVYWSLDKFFLKCYPFKGTLHEIADEQLDNMVRVTQRDNPSIGIWMPKGLLLSKGHLSRGRESATLCLQQILLEFYTGGQKQHEGSSIMCIPHLIFGTLMRITN